MKALFISFLILPFCLFAQDWKVISVGDNSNFYIRKHSENPNDTKVWIKEEGTKIEYKNSAGKKVFIKGKHIVLWDIHCDEKQIALISSTVYNSAGTVLNNTVIPAYSVEFQDVIPESKGEQWLDEACHLFNPEEVEEEMEEESIEVDTVAAEELVEYIEPETEETTIEVETIAAEEEIIAESEVEEEEEEIYTSVEHQAEFPGGIAAWGRYLSTTLKYPAAAQRAKMGGRVFVSFVVNTDGSVEDVQLLRGMGYGCDEEAIRVIKAMPKWNPAIQGGKKVRSRFTQPITFAVQ
ncbi:energy transducer TonB [Aquirufa sp. HETE-83D]|jgi:TonB family protein|uniref:Energy transducer TonB n=1 Tax=Aquirufa esocilacus TaxID=3096513 RepID=A0ABW6DJQ1_9BACT